MIQRIQMYQFLILSFLALFLSGCAGSSQYQKFASAGVIYTAAADKLLITTRDIGIDSSSEALLKEYRFSDRQMKNNVITPAKKQENLNYILSATQESDVSLVGVVTKLRKHSRLLSKYFQQLNKLATSDSPDTIAAATEGVVTQINTLGNALRGSAFISNPGDIGTLTKIAVGISIRKNLKDEFEKNQFIIFQELQTQEHMLGGLSAFLAKELADNLERRTERLVITPYVESKLISKRDTEEWISSRKALLTAQATISELSTAEELAVKLREAYMELVKGNEEIDLDTLLVDLGSFLTIIETIN